MAQRSFLKDISGVFGSNLLALINAFLVDVILSRELGPEGRGLYAAVLVVPLIVVSFALLGIRRSAVFHLGQKIFDEDRVVSGILSLMIMSSILAMVASSLAFLWIAPTGLSLPIATMAILSVPVKLIIVYAGGIYIGKEEFRRSNLQVWLPHFLNVLGITLFVILLRGYVFGALLSLFLSNMLVALFSLVHLLKRYKVRIGFDKQVLKSLSQLGITYALAVVIMQLNYRVDLLLLQELSTMKEVGYYSLGVAISDKLWQLPSAIGLVVMSRSANATNEEKLNRDVARLLRVSFLIVMAAALILWFVVPYLLPWIFGSRFIPSIAIVRWMLPGILMFVIVRILSGRFAGKGQPLLLVSVFVPALLLNVLLNLLWIPTNGGVGAAWASNISYAAGAIALLVVYSRHMKIPLKEVLSFKRSDFEFTRGFLKRFSKS